MTAGSAGVGKAAPALGTTGLLDALLAAPGSPPPAATAKPPAAGRLEKFLAATSPIEAIVHWLGPEGLKAAPSAQAVLRRLSIDIARLDELLSRQVNAILHHPRFQQLEASWRGLRYLVEQAEGEEGVKIRVLSASWKDLARDVERAVEFDQTQLFRKVYSDEFGMPGGEPFGVLIGDYSIRHRMADDHPVDDLTVLASIAQVAAASFSPFIASAHPALFGLENFSQLERPMDMGRIFDQPEYIRWKSFRESEDSRFVGLALPRILMRHPYGDDGSREDGFRFQEEVEGPDARGYLWGNAAYAFAGVLIRAFSQAGWLAEIRGVRRGEDGGGLVTGLPVHSFSTDRVGVALKGSTELMVTDVQEKELGELGFLPLCRCPDTEFSAFYGTQSVQKPKAYTEAVPTINARISAMLQYMLCVSRFAHYIKVRTQYKVGSFAEARELEDDLNRWINDYVAPDAEASADVKAKYPLREAQVQVRERPGKPGMYNCVLHLLPHYQLDTVTASVTLRTELGAGPGAGAAR